MTTLNDLTDFHQALPSPPIQNLKDPLFDSHHVNLSVLRTDQVHPTIQGNKWYKLHYNLREALQQNHHTILTFGGAYSNHIYAAAAAGQLFGLRTIGVIRGEEHQPLNPILAFAHKAGMTLHYLTRQDYRQKHSQPILQYLQAQFGPFYMIPEGGANLLGVRGCMDIVPQQQFDYICCACGTGGTLAGLIAGASPQTTILGFSVLKGADFLYHDIQNYLSLLKTYLESSSTPINALTKWHLIHDYHFGGYAKKTPELLTFVEQFQTQHNLPIEHVYTGKLFYGLYQIIKKGYFKKGSSILVIHSGGVY